MFSPEIAIINQRIIDIAALWKGGDQKSRKKPAHLSAGKLKPFDEKDCRFISKPSSEPFSEAARRLELLEPQQERTSSAFQR